MDDQRTFECSRWIELELRRPSEEAKNNDINKPDLEAVVRTEISVLA